MNRTRKRNPLGALVVVLPALALGIAGSALSTSADPGGRHGGDGPSIERLAERLGLTDEQTSRIEDIRESGKKERIQLDKQLRRLEHELRGALLEDEPDESDVVSIAERVGDVRTRLEVMRLRHRLAIRRVLTPEQRDSLLSHRRSPDVFRGRGGKDGRRGDHRPRDEGDRRWIGG